MLYALLLDRQQLSKKNGLTSKFGESFVYMTIEETCKKLNCGHEKACRLYKELEHCNLIIRKSQGLGTFTCTVCKGTKTETIKATGHKAVTDKAVAATCTKDGKTEGSHCSVCGAVLKAQTAVSAPGHKWDGGKVTKAATCTANGVKTFTCSVCKETKTEAIKASGHKAVTDKAVAATCTKDGKTEGSHCSVCSTVLKAQTTLSATGHKWDGGKVTKVATCAATGVKTYTCTVCKTTKTETIAKTNNHS